MWESPERFPRAVGWVGKQFYRFSMHPTDRHFHRLFPIGRSSRGDRCCGLVPVLLELDRTDVVERRVQSCPVIPEQPCDRFILGFPESVKMLAMQPFHLQRTE